MERERDFLRIKIHTKRENWGISFLSFVICPRTEETTEQDIRKEPLQGRGRRRKTHLRKRARWSCLTCSLSELPTGRVTVVRDRAFHMPPSEDGALVHDFGLASVGVVSRRGGNPPGVEGYGVGY